METVDLDFFNGKTFTLTAVDSTKTYGRCEYADDDSGGIAFTLDGITYAAVEDPDDGYRSMLDRVIILGDDEPMATPLPPTKVLARKRLPSPRDERPDILDFIDPVSENVLIAIGTSHEEDYYPFFVGAFFPQKAE